MKILALKKYPVLEAIIDQATCCLHSNVHCMVVLRFCGNGYAVSILQGLCEQLYRNSGGSSILVRGGSSGKAGLKRDRLCIVPKKRSALFRDSQHALEV